MPWIELRKLAPHALDRTSQISATRPERAEAPSPGQRPGFFMPASLSPCKGKSFKTWCLVKLLPLQGALLIAIIPRALPWARSFCPFRACCFYPFSSNSFCNRMISSRYCAACMKSRSLAACFIRAVVLAMLFSSSSLLMLRTIGSATIVALSGSI